MMCDRGVSVCTRIDGLGLRAIPAFARQGVGPSKTEVSALPSVDRHHPCQKGVSGGHVSLSGQGESGAKRAGRS